jgi:hypothetical protein
MQTIILAVFLGLGSFGVAQTQSDSAIVGTWTAKAGCRHGGGETLTLTITRDAEGRLHGARLGSLLVRWPPGRGGAVHDGDSRGRDSRGNYHRQRPDHPVEGEGRGRHHLR